MNELKLVYFSWVRERIGLPEETLALPDTVKTIADLARYLGTRGEHYAYAFENPAIVRENGHVVHRGNVDTAGKFLQQNYGIRWSPDKMYSKVNQ